jgi:hypothetical protein
MARSGPGRRSEEEKEAGVDSSHKTSATRIRRDGESVSEIVTARVVKCYMKK